jgi:predicted MFS family arabinose efflux permease
MYVLALLALVLGVAGLGISLSNMRSGPSINLVIGILAALCMIILMFQISADVKGETNKPDRVSDFTDSVKVTVNYTFWFYLSVCSFLAAAFFSYKHKQLAVVPEEPSKETPQLDLQDRTDQSEFPRAASEPEIG